MKSLVSPDLQRATLLFFFVGTVIVISITGVVILFFWDLIQRNNRKGK